MTTPERAPVGQHTPAAGTAHFGMEGVVGYILLVGLLVSMALIVIGLVWRWLATDQLGLEYSIASTNLFGFVLADLQQMFSGVFRPRLFTNLGLAVLTLTPYVRVLASMLYFALVENNRKYTVVTGFVFAVLTYSLFLR
jgi:uncharacterized membrane protein